MTRPIIKSLIYAGMLVIASMPDLVHANVKFVALADIHFDPFATCVIDQPCALIQALEQAPVKQWYQIFARRDIAPQQYYGDTHFNLLHKTSLFLANINKKGSPEFVVVLGDTLGHHFVENFHRFSDHPSQADMQRFVQKTFRFISMTLKQAFPKTNIFFAIGNNDSYVEDNIFDTDSILYRDLAHTLGRLLHDKSTRNTFSDTFIHNGYYAVSLPKHPKLKLIMLNSAIFSPWASGDGIHVARAAELNWLEQTLAVSQATHQQVILMMHTPVGIDIFGSLQRKPFRPIQHWTPDSHARLMVILKNNANIIRGMLAAHVHGDWFQVLTLSDQYRPIPVLGIPSLTPRNGNNPAIKMIELESSTFDLLDYQKYFFPLAQQMWQKEYRFNDIYQPGCSQCQIADGISNVLSDDLLIKSFQKFYDSETGTDSIHTHFSPYYECQLNTVDVDKYQACVTSHSA
jgi:sphingomyelin phosphodiesterase acid-like 3